MDVLPTTEQSSGKQDLDALDRVGEPLQAAIKREGDSLDDFEHLGHDVSPLVENVGIVDDKTSIEKINTSAGQSDSAISGVQGRQSLLDTTSSSTMDSNLLDLVDTIPDRKEADAKLDKFLNELSAATATTEKQLKENVKEKVEDVKIASQNFMDMERSPIFHDPSDLMERFSDSDPEDDFRLTKEELPPKKDQPKMDMFKDFDDFELPKATPPPVLTHEKISPTWENIPEPVKPKPMVEIPTKPVEIPPKPVEIPQKPVEIPKPVVKEVEIPKPVIQPLPKPKEPEQPKKEDVKSIKQEVKPKPISNEDAIPKFQAEAMFCKMGLDAWFCPEKLNPKVADLIYWRDPKKSGPVFAGVLIVLLALTYFSLISVVAYLSLLGLTGTISFRVYKNIVQAVQKTGDGHPFKELLDSDLSLPQEKVEEISKVAVAHFNAAIVELGRLFLVEDLVDSIKFGVLLWCLTYLGAWFNGMTLIIIAWVALFTLPKVYETNKTQIDANLDIVRNKLDEITSKVKAAIPIGKKTEEKKEQ